MTLYYFRKLIMGEFVIFIEGSGKEFVPPLGKIIHILMVQLWLGMLVLRLYCAKVEYATIVSLP